MNKAFPYILLILLLSFRNDAKGQAPTFYNGGLKFNGPVLTQKQVGTTNYVGGSFTAINATTGPLVGIDPTTLQPASTALAAVFAKINGTVRTVCADGVGGMYIGGSFNYSIGSTNIIDFMRVSSGGTIISMQQFAPVVLGVNKILVHAGRVYVLHNSGIKCFTQSSNTEDLSFPASQANGQANDAVVYGNNIYFGGRFFVNGNFRPLIRIAATSNSFDFNWNPNIRSSSSTFSINNAIINTIELYNQNLIYGGQNINFQGSSSRMNLGGINLQSNGAYALAVQVSGTVSDLAIAGTNLFIGGNFLSLRNAGSTTNIPRRNLALISLINNQVFTIFAPDPDGTVKTLAVVNNNLLVGGYFFTIQGQTNTYRNAAFSNANVLGQTILNPTVAPNPNAGVEFIGAVNNLIMIGGQFTQIEFAKRNRVAAFNTQTGLPTTFNPTIKNGTVYAIEAAGANVFIGGSFTTQSGSYNCNNFVTYFNTGNANTNVVLNFNNTVRSIAASGSTLLVGGDFTTTSTPINNATIARNNLASFTIGTTASINLGFNANIFNGTVRVVKILGGSVFVGGNFSSPRNKIAKLNLNNGNVVSTFNARINGTGNWNGWVNDIVQSSANQIAIGGLFGLGFNQALNGNFSLGTTGNGGLAILDWNNGNLMSRNSNVSGEVNSMVKPFANTIEYSDLTSIKTFNISNGTTSTLLPSINGGVGNIAYYNNSYAFGGNFNQTIGNVFYANLGFLNYTPPAGPTIAASNFNVTNVTMNSMRINFAPGNGQNRIVIARQWSYPAASPINGSAYMANSTPGFGSSIGGGSVVYNGSGSFADVTGLNPNTPYYFQVYEYNGTGINTMYGINRLEGMAFTQDLQIPSVSSTNLNFSQVTINSMQLNWVRGNGQACIVFAKQGSPVDFIPAPNVNYNTSSTFGQMGYGNGNFAVYKGSMMPNVSALVEGLQPGLTYHFAIYEYNEFGTLRRYRTIFPGVGNRQTIGMASPPTNPGSSMTFQNFGSSSTQVNWQPGNGNKRLVLAFEGSLTAVINSFPANGVFYSANANYSIPGNTINVRATLNGNGGLHSGKVVYNGTGNSVTVTGLLANKEYSYLTIEYNELPGLPGSAAYLTDPNLSGSKKTDQAIQPPSINASAPSSFETHNAARFKWTNGNGSQRMVVMRQDLPVDFSPLNNVNYVANPNYASGTDLGNGNKVIFNGPGIGSGGSVDISGLLPYTTYHFKIFEYNSALNSGTSVMEYAYRTAGARTFFTKTAAPNWPRTAGGSESDAAGSVAVDASGNVYVAGTVRGNSNFGLQEITAVNNDIFLAKYNATGNLLWVKQAGGAGEDAASSVVLDASGNVYISGSFRNTANFDSLTVTSSGSDDGFIAKYSSSGNPIWARSFGSDSQDVVNTMAIDGLGNIYVGGFHSGNTGFSNSTVTLTTNGKSDLIAAKYNSNGDLIWARGGGSNGYDFGFGIGTDGNGNVFICGEIKGTGTFGTQTSGFAGATDAILVKYNASGVAQSATNYGSTGDDKAMSLDVDANGIVYMAGIFSGTVAFGSSNLVCVGVTDGYLVKINGVNGAIQWVKQQGGISQDAATGVDIGSNGEIYVTGTFGGTSNFDAQSLTSTGNLDIFVAIYSSTGVMNVAKRFGGPNDDAARGIYAILPNNTFVCGYFNKTATFGGFEMFTKVQPAPPNGNWDMFVHNIGATYDNNPTADLVAWFRFNGNANDFSGNNHNGTIVSTPPSNSVTSINDRNNTTNSAYEFQGSGRVEFTIPNNSNFSNLNEVTIMAWARVSSFPAGMDHVIMSSDRGNPLVFDLYIDQNRGLLGQIMDGSGNPVGSAASANLVYTQSSWAHIALTYQNGIQSQIFLNGNAVGTTPFFSPGTCNLGGKSYTIGASGNMVSPFILSDRMNGAIDDVRIYKRALSAVQIQDIMSATPALSIPPREETTRLGNNSSTASLWPNPSSGTIQFEILNEEKQNINYTLIDITGKIVYQELAEAQEIGMIRKSFDLSNLPAGFYNLHVNMGQVQNNFKLILNK
jgi:hypothetical protein